MRRSGVRIPIGPPLRKSQGFIGRLIFFNTGIYKKSLFWVAFLYRYVKLGILPTYISNPCHEGVVANSIFQKEEVITMAKLVERVRSATLDPMLREMAKLQTEIRDLETLYEELQKKAFPLVESAGDVYQVDGIKAEIIRSQTWQVDAIRLLDKVGKKAFGLLTVSASKFRKAFEAGTLGTKTELKGIAKLVDESPKFRLSRK